MSELPRAPTFPTFVDDIKEVEEEPLPVDYKNISSVKDLSERFVAKDSSVPSPSRPVTTTTSSFAPKHSVSTLPTMDENSSTSSSVPVVPLPVVNRKSRIKSILLWQNPKVTGLILAGFMLFFYLTLYKGLSILEVIGGLMAVYLITGLIVVNFNNIAGNQLDRYIKRPAVEVPIFKKESVNRWAETLIDEGNDIGDFIRNVLYCDNVKLTMTWIFISLVVYILGKYFSLLPVFFVLTLLAFTLPLAYEKNKKDVDAVVARASDAASKQIESGRKVAAENAMKLRDLAAEKMDKGPPVARSLGAKLGLTPKKKM